MRKQTKKKHQWVVLTALVKVTTKKQFECVEQIMKEGSVELNLSAEELAEVKQLGILDEIKRFGDRLSSRNRGTKCLLVKTTG